MSKSFNVYICQLHIANLHLPGNLIYGSFITISQYIQILVTTRHFMKMFLLFCPLLLYN
jgi:hypothetical protein